MSPRTASRSSCKECTLPLTGRRVVDMVITELGVFGVDKHGDGGVTLVELADGVTVDEVKAKTKAKLAIAAGVKARPRLRLPLGQELTQRLGADIGEAPVDHDRPRGGAGSVVEGVPVIVGSM